MLDVTTVAKTIRSFRQAAGLSQEVLSGLAGLDRTHYSKIERGLRMPTLVTLFQIADALDISPHQLIKAIEEEQHKYDTPER